MDIGKLNGPPEEAQTSFVETNTTGNQVIPHAMRRLRSSLHLLDHNTQARAKAPAAATYWATAKGIRPSIKTYVQSQRIGDSPCATHALWCNCMSPIVAPMATRVSKRTEITVLRIIRVCDFLINRRSRRAFCYAFPAFCCRWSKNRSARRRFARSGGLGLPGAGHVVQSGVLYVGYSSARILRNSLMG